MVHDYRFWRNLIGLLFILSWWTGSVLAYPQLSSPQQPPGAIFPNLSQGNPQDPFYTPPTDNLVITGNAQYSTSFPQAGEMNSVPYHDTGTDASTSYQLQPDWSVPLSKGTAPDRVITYPPYTP